MTTTTSSNDDSKSTKMGCHVECSELIWFNIIWGIYAYDARNMHDNHDRCAFVIGMCTARKCLQWHLLCGLDDEGPCVITTLLKKQQIFLIVKSRNTDCAIFADVSPLCAIQPWMLSSDGSSGSCHADPSVYDKESMHRGCHCYVTIYLKSHTWCVDSAAANCCITTSSWL